MLLICLVKCGWMPDRTFLFHFVPSTLGGYLGCTFTCFAIYYFVHSFELLVLQCVIDAFCRKKYQIYAYYVFVFNPGLGFIFNVRQTYGGC